MQGVSRTSSAEGTERLEALLDATPDAGARRELGEQLFAVVGVLDGSVRLRRALTDPSRDGEAKSVLLGRLLEQRVGQDCLDLLSGLVRSRWSRAGDLADAVESLGVLAVLAAAESDARLEQVEEEVFRVGRAVTGDRALRQALMDRRGTAEARATLVTRLLGSSAAPETVVLAAHVAAVPRGRSPEAAFESVAAAAATRRQRLVAHVTMATWPTDEQQARLAAALATMFDRQVRLAIDLDPEVLGGMRVQVGDVVIDGSLSRRLQTVTERLGR